MDKEPKPNIEIPTEGTVIPSFPILSHEVKKEEKNEYTSSTINSKALSLPKKAPNLTRKAQSFLEHLLAGKSTLEAYRLAGYNGKGNAPYELRHRLKEHLVTALETHGLDRIGIKIRVKRLLEKGEESLEKSEINPKLYLQTLKFLATLDRDTKDPDIKISPFVINTDTVNINESKSV